MLRQISDDIKSSPVAKPAGHLVMQMQILIIIIHFFRNWLPVRTVKTEKFAWPNVGLAWPLVLPPLNQSRFNYYSPFFKHIRVGFYRIYVSKKRFIVKGDWRNQL